MTAWELIDWTLKASGLGPAEAFAEKRWEDFIGGFKKMHFLDGFATPDGRFHFKPDWSRMGPLHAMMPELPDHLPNIDVADDEHRSGGERVS